MGLIKNLFGKNNSSYFLDDELTAVGVCPNCWGKQQYDNKYEDFVADQTKANINHDKSNQKAFIQQFVETNITGIHLKSEGPQHSCPVCETIYK